MIVNFDANASNAMLPEVIDKLQGMPRHAMNPSASHQAGQKARALIEEARAEIVMLVGAAKGDRIIFTSGATESNNTALFSPFWSELSSRSPTPTEKSAAQLVTSSVEHHAVLEVAHALESYGVRISQIYPRIIKGQPAAANFVATDFLSACGPCTKIISAMMANNETGMLLPVQELATLVKRNNPHILVHTDAVQALGKIKFQFSTTDIDMLSISAHKIGGLSGVGALVIKKGVSVEPYLRGGPQEARFRAGTENVTGIVSFGEAAKIVRTRFEERVTKMKKNIQLIYDILKEKVSDLIRNTPHAEALPNTLNVSFPNVRAQDLLVALDIRGICISAGSACNSGKIEPSHVLTSIGVDPLHLASSVRISVEAEYDSGVVEKAAHQIASCVAMARKEFNPEKGAYATAN